MKSNSVQPPAAFLAVALLSFIVAAAPGALAQAPNGANKLPSGEPCTVVPLPDVQKAFPGAKPGVRSSRVEKYGLTECEWKDGTGQVVLSVQEFYGEDSAMDEAKGLAMGFGAAGNVRYETLAAAGLGSEAVAFVETRDGKRGISADGALLVLHRGQRTLFVASPVLQQRDRAAALKSLGELGRVAARRLQ